MGDKVVLSVEERKVLGKKVKQLRRQGLVPGVVYGHDVDPTAIMAPANMVEKAWRDAGRRQPVEVTLDGKKRLAMIKSAEFDPVKHRLRHLSLHVVKQNEKVATEVPVHILGEGETEAEKIGLVVLKTIDLVEIEALPKNLPEFLQVDGAKLIEPGDHLTVADIIPVDSVTVLTDPTQTLVTVYEPSALQAANDAAGGDAEPGDEENVTAEEGAVEETGEATEEKGRN